MHPASKTNPYPTGASVLASLRTLAPNRRLTLAEALRVAELQAGHLLRLCGVDEAAVPIDIVSDQPKILIESDSELPLHAASGCSRWDAVRRCWIVSVNPEEPATRQRFTVLHEYKHILDHYNRPLLTPASRSRSRVDPVEYVADYFAGCALIPKQWLKTAYFSGVQRTSDLADLFDVSARAIEVRLSQIGISSTATGRIAPDSGYRRQRPQNFLESWTRNTSSFAPASAAPQNQEISEHD